MGDQEKVQFSVSKASKNKDNTEGGQGENREKKNIHKLDPTDVTIGDFHININKQVVSVEPMEILEKLYHIRHDQNLTREEKVAKVQQLMKEI